MKPQNNCWDIKVLKLIEKCVYLVAKSVPLPLLLALCDWCQRLLLCVCVLSLYSLLSPLLCVYSICTAVYTVYCTYTVYWLYDGTVLLCCSYYLLLYSIQSTHTADSLCVYSVHSSVQYSILYTVQYPVRLQCSTQWVCACGTQVTYVQYSAVVYTVRAKKRTHTLCKQQPAEYSTYSIYSSMQSTGTLCVRPI